MSNDVGKHAMSDIHDSATCTLGPDGGPCDQCRAANEYEERRLSDPVLLQRLTMAMARDRQVASVTVVRAALADVLDGGYQCSRGCDLKHPWLFPTELFPGDKQPTDDDLGLRERFLDAVTARIAELQAPPHNMDARLLAEVERARKVLRRGGKR